MKSYFLVQLFGERVSMIYFPIFQEYMYKVQSDSLVLIHHVQVKIQDNGDLRLTALEATRVESLPLGGFNRIQNSVDPDLFIPAWEWKSCTHAYQYISNISHGKNNETSSTPVKLDLPHFLSINCNLLILIGTTLSMPFATDGFSAPQFLHTSPPLHSQVPPHRQHNIILEADKHELSKNTDKSWYRRSRHHQILIKLAQNSAWKNMFWVLVTFPNYFPAENPPDHDQGRGYPNGFAISPHLQQGVVATTFSRTRFPGFPKRGQRPKVLEPMPDAERKHEARSFTRLRLFHRDFGWNDLGKMSINELGKKLFFPTTPKRTWPLKNGVWETFLFGKVPIFRYTISFGEVNSEVQRAGKKNQVLWTLWAFGTFLQVKKGARPKEAGSIYIYTYDMI